VALGSSQIFILKKLKAFGKKYTAKVKSRIHYLPAETSWGANATVYQLPKRRVSKYFSCSLTQSKDLIIKCTKINESGVVRPSLNEQKHYVIRFFSRRVGSFGRIFFRLWKELDLEKLVYHLRRSFLSNNSEQNRRMKYEFWRLILSRFADWWEKNLFIPTSFYLTFFLCWKSIWYRFDQGKVGGVWLFGDFSLMKNSLTKRIEN